MYIAVTFISLASFQCTATTVCLASGVVVHRITNNDRLNTSKIIAICVCTVGICFATQPEFLHHVLGLSSQKAQDSALNQTTNITKYQDSESTTVTSDSNEILGYILACIFGVFLSLQIALMRKLTSSEDFRPHYISYLFWNFTFGIVMSSALMLVGDVFSINQMKFSIEPMYLIFRKLKNCLNGLVIHY